MKGIDTDKQNIKEFEKNIYGVLDAMKGFFRMDVAALLILPQVFVFRLYKLAKEGELPERYKVLKLEEMELNNIKDLCDVMTRLHNSNLSELQGSMGPFLHEFESMIGEDVFDKVFDRIESANYSITYLNKNEFGKVFTSLMGRLFEGNPSHGGNMSSNLTQNIFAGIKLSPGQYTIIDPAFGIGSSMIGFIKKQRKGVNVEVHGFEINQRTYSYAVMNLICNGIYAFRLTCGDSLKCEWNTNFDLILADLPFRESIETELIKKARLHLNANGRACFLVSNKNLFSKGKQLSERKQWIHQKLLKKVISLPEGVGKENTNVPVSFLYMENSKGGEKFIEFYDLDSPSNKTDFNLIKVVENLFTPVVLGSEIYKQVEYKEVIENGYSLLPNRYVGSIHETVEELKQKERGIELKEILEREFGTKPGESELEKLSNKYLKIGDLLDDPFDFKIDSLKLNTTYEDINRDRVREISGSFLLLAKSGKKLKPTYVEALAKPILIDQSIYAFKVNHNKVRLDYLFYQLHTDFFREQIDLIQRGNYIPYLPKKELLNTVIELPINNEHDSNIAQRNYLDEKKKDAFEALHRQQKKEKEKFREKLSVKEKEEKLQLDEQEEELIEYVNHNVRNKLSRVKDSIELLYDYFEANEGKPIHLSDLEGIPLEDESKNDLNSIDELFNFAKDGMNKALYILRNLEDFRVDQFKPEDFEVINLYEWLKKYVYDADRKKGYKININSKEHDTTIIKTNLVKASFENVLDNLLENAEKHGFKGNKSNFSILFDLSIDQDFIVLDYKNDGKPLIQGMTKQKFITRGDYAGENAGTGFGGFFINRTIEKLGGKFSIIDIKSPSQWNVHFRIKLPTYLEE